MCDDQIPDMPEWIRALFTERMTCPRCQHRFRLEHVIGVGIHIPQSGEAFERQPCARITVTCEKCYKDTFLHIVKDKDSILMGVEALFDYILSQPDPTDEMNPFLPSPNFAPPTNGYDDIDVVPHKTPAEKRMDANRSRREGQLAHPPDDREVEVFLNKLKATSFKISSKSYRKFMHALGIDLSNLEKEDECP